MMSELVDKHIKGHEARDVRDMEEFQQEALRPKTQVQPDGGWGWVVCLTATLCYGSVGTFFAAFSILYVEMLKQYGKGDPNISSKTAQIGSLYYGVSCIMSPVAGVISDKIGIRKTAVIGAVITSIGLISSAFVENLMLMYLTYSLMVGIGSGCVYSQSFVILGHYFKRRLGIVSGLYYCGVPLFTIVMTLGLPPMLDTIGLSYTLLVQSCLAFVWIPCALTWKPLLRKVEREEIIEPQVNHVLILGDNAENTTESVIEKENILKDTAEKSSHLYYTLEKPDKLYDTSEKRDDLCDRSEKSGLLYDTSEKSDHLYNPLEDSAHLRDMSEKPKQSLDAAEQTSCDQTETLNHMCDTAEEIARVKTTKATCFRFRTLLDMSIWRNKYYLVWVMSVAIIMFGYFTPFVHVVQFAKVTFPDHDGTKLVIWIYISSGVFRFIAGQLSDFKWVNPIRLSQLALLAMCICYNCLPYLPSFTVLLVVCNAIGASDGCFYCLLGPITVRLVGEGSTSQGYGFLLGILSIPATFGPPVGGLLYDRLGNYTVAFHLAGCVPLIGLLLLFFIQLPRMDIH